MYVGLTLWQPWAALIALKEKTVETRPWRPPEQYMGRRIAIHASKGVAPGGEQAFEELCESEPFRSALRGRGLGRELLRSRIVCTATLARVAPTLRAQHEMLKRAAAGEDTLERVHRELAFGDYSDGRWAWKLTDIVPMDPPVPCAGAQKLWPVPIEPASEVQRLEYDYFTPPLGFGGEEPRCPECNDDGFVIGPVCCRQYRETGGCCGEPDVEDKPCPSCQG